MFGEFIKDLRLKNDLTLREFCRLINEDPSNWSKIERGILTPPQSEEKLKMIAEALMIDINSSEFQKMGDLAAISAGKIPKYILEDKNIVNALPAFLRTIESIKPSEEEIYELIKRIKEEE